MTRKQKVELKMSENRGRISEIMALDQAAMTPDIKNELKALVSARADLETEYRASMIAEGDDEARMQGAFGGGDGESAEVRALMGRVSIADYLRPAAGGVGIAGAAVELNAALGVEATGKSGGVSIPWAVLAGRPRMAFTDTGDLGGGVAQRPVLQRLFGPGILDALGVRIDSVPSGRSEWPLITGGVAPANVAEGTAAADAVAASFSTESLKPKRLTGRYEYTHEQAAEVPLLEEALRRDLGDAVKAKMSDLALNGDESTNSHEPSGFLEKLAVPAVPAAVAIFEDFVGAAGSAVDGIHAGSEDEVSCVLGVTSYQLATRTYRSLAGSDESASEALKRRSMMCMASSYVPAVAAMVQNGNIFHAAGPNGGGADMRGDSVAAVWPTLEVIRDIYSKASQGVVLTWVTLWDLEAAFRAASYKRVSFKVST